MISSNSKMHRIARFVKRSYHRCIGLVLVGSAVLYITGTQTGLHVLNVLALIPLAMSLVTIVKEC